MGVFFLQKSPELLIIGLLKFRLEQFVPAAAKMYHRHSFLFEIFLAV